MLSILVNPVDPAELAALSPRADPPTQPPDGAAGPTQTPAIVSPHRCEPSAGGPPRPCGVLAVDKPAGPSSARVVTRVRNLLPRGAKVGHAGTLDPFATGLLLVLVGKATRWSGEMMALPKQYVATIRLGGVTDSHDLEQPVRPVPAASEPPAHRVAAAVAALVGTIEQRPPAFSAVRIGGRKAYRLARAGRAPEPQPRAVRIDAIDILAYTWPDLVLRIDCGKGTYIRSIARDLGETLGVGGYLTALRRTRVGPFSCDDAERFDTLSAESLRQNLRDATGQPLPRH